jgi:hypothetical protein
VMVWATALLILEWRRPLPQSRLSVFSSPAVS